MSEAAVIAPAVATCELRVLGGRADGATASLERWRWVEIGYGLSSDIVIRDPAAKGVRLRLRPRDDSAELEVLEGDVEFLGHVLAAPATAILPAYVPLKLGASAVAFGEPGADRWDDAERLLRAGAGEPESDEPSAADDALGPLPRWRLISPALRGLTKYQAALPVAAGALAAVLLAGLGWALASHWLNGVPSAERATEILAADGFRGVKVEATDTGLIAHGLLPRYGDLARLRDDVARRDLPIALAVRTNDQLAQGVADVLRTNGYQARVKAIGLGLLVADVQGGDPAGLENARQEALRDNPGLKQLIVNGGGEGAALSTAIASNDPNKAVVSVVGGDLGYIATADGARYFVGAILPTGHKIVSIDGQDVTVELNGNVTHLKF